MQDPHTTRIPDGSMLITPARLPYWATRDAYREGLAHGLVAGVAGALAVAAVTVALLRWAGL